MTCFRTLSHLTIAGLLAVGLLVPHAMAQPSPSAGSYDVAQGGGNCHAIGLQHAAQAGGQLARATAEVRGGRQVCVIVVLMPARDGQRPRRNEIVVPAG